MLSIENYKTPQKIRILELKSLKTFWKINVNKKCTPSPTPMQSITTFLGNIRGKTNQSGILHEKTVHPHVWIRILLYSSSLKSLTLFFIILLISFIPSVSWSSVHLSTNTKPKFFFHGLSFVSLFEKHFCFWCSHNW